MVLTLVFGGCADSSRQVEPTDLAPTAQVDSGLRVVTYYAKGSPAYASVTMATPSGTTQADPDLPMKLEDSLGLGITLTFDAGDFVYLSVQNPNASGRVTCQIEVDGEIVSENTAFGGYAIATCKASA